MRTATKQQRKPPKPHAAGTKRDNTGLFKPGVSQRQPWWPARSDFAQAREAMQLEGLVCIRTLVEIHDNR
jgi:hypothetical protein